MTFIKIAARNIIRNKKRSLITISAIGFGLGALIFLWSFIDGIHIQMIENYTSLLSGHIQIHQKGFHKKQQLETYIIDPQPIISNVRQTPFVKAATSRIKAFGLVSSSEYSSGVIVFGVDPINEPKVSTLYKRIREGTFLTSDSDKDIIIGKSLAENLDVMLDEKIVIMSQAIDGSIAAGAFYVRGILDTGTEEIDKGVVLITLTAAQDLFVMQDKVSEITINLNTLKNTQDSALLLTEKLNMPQLEIMAWEDISPSFQQWIEFDNSFMWLIVIVVMIVVAIGILNTILMGVLERTREFGILLALGTKRHQIISTVMWESLFLGLAGGIFGLSLGLLFNIYFQNLGIDLSVFTQALNDFYIDSLIYPYWDSQHVLISIALVLGISNIVAIYPAWHAANLKPVEAIRAI